MSLQIYAPSLRSLPADVMLVMATLPVIDWNDCLLRDLRTLKKRTPVPAYAAIVMIDPFACWEDFAELLKDAEITGIINFPPASILERSSAGVPVETGQELELRRMEWFASLGFKALFAAANESDVTAAERRLGSQLDGVVYLPSEALALTIGTDMGLVSLGLQGASVPKFALLDATASKRPLPT
ncbi:putative TIM-barrel enzyme [Bradyrhizobium sp. USDA 4341]